LGSDIVSIFFNQDSIINLDRIKELKQEAWVCSNQKAKEFLNFTPQYSLKQGLEETISWYIKNNWL
jgi:nucleoside-diphosphate-sugar epimerase